MSNDNEELTTKIFVKNKEVKELTEKNSEILQVLEKEKLQKDEVKI